MATSCEVSVSLLDILEILRRFLLNFKLIAHVDVQTALVKLFVILLMSTISTFLKESIECW